MQYNTHCKLTPNDLIYLKNHRLQFRQQFLWNSNKPNAPSKAALIPLSWLICNDDKLEEKLGTKRWAEDKRREKMLREKCSEGHKTLREKVARITKYGE